MRQFNWRTCADLKIKPNVEYINGCCCFGDDVLAQTAAGICEKLRVRPEKIVIGQEDWGWYLEFQIGDVYYNLDINYQGRDETEKHVFAVVVQAEKRPKGFILRRKIDAVQERDEFVQTLEIIARENMFEIDEE